MSLSVTYLHETFATSPQLSLADLAEVKQAGFATVINNRPDFEGGPDQPSDTQMREAAKALGLAYAYLPVVSGQLTQAQVSSMAQLVRDSAKPVLAYCRSGTRSGMLYRLATES